MQPDKKTPFYSINLYDNPVCIATQYNFEYNFKKGIQAVITIMLSLLLFY